MNIPNSKYLNIQQDRYDVWKASTLLEVAEASFGSIIDDPALRLMYHELWAALYKIEPRLRSGYHPDSVMQRRVIEDLLNRPEFLKLRAGTVLQAHPAAQAAGVILREVRNQFEQPEEDDSMQDIEEPEGGEDADKAMSEDELDEDTMVYLKEQIEKADKIAEKIKPEHIEKAAEDVESVKVALRMLGHGHGRGRGMRPADMSKLTIRLINTPGLRELLRRAGKMSFFAESKQRERFEHGRDEIDGIEFDNDLENIVTDEYALLADPTGLLALEFYRKFAEGELQVHTFTDEQDIEGPVILCIDQSGSMSGEPDRWAKALGLSLAHLCRQKQRDFHVIFFDTRVVGEMTFPKGEGDYISFISQKMSGGGTAFEPPLGRCLDIIRTSKTTSGATAETWRKADVIFLTDDQCAISDLFVERWKKEKQELRQRLYAVFIGAYSAGYGIKNSCLGPIADAAFHTSSHLLDEKHEALECIFTHV